MRMLHYVSNKKKIEVGLMPFDYQTIHRQVLSNVPECERLIEQIRQLKINADFPYSEFFIATRDVLLQSWDFYLLIQKDPELKDISLEDLASLTDAFYSPLEMNIGYENCIGNPDYCSKLYQAEMGAFCSAVYTRARGVRNSIRTEGFLYVHSTFRLYMELYNAALKGNSDYAAWLEIYKNEAQRDFRLKVTAGIASRYCPETDVFKKILMTSDLSDIRYMYRYGVYLSKHDFAMASFMNTYPINEIGELAKYIVRSWIAGFERAKKDYRKKRYANLIFPAGMERLGQMIVHELEQKGIEALVNQPLTNGINHQYSYDHRFDEALTLDRDFVENSLEIGAEVMDELKEIIALQAGPIYVELFGEMPFSPISKNTTIKLSEDQQALSREHGARNAQLYYRYYKRDEASFTIIAFPSPEIGDKFPEIFSDTLKINLLDSDKYAQIQQKIIDVLDTAEYVHVKGKPGNDTDIMVKMHPLTDPEHQTLFENCVADVNIPVGEVFTSPLLKGTSGMLHVEDIYLSELRYYNLRISFEDGWVKDYSCSNFDSVKEGMDYIHENLLLPHASLPIGEFAIGTNTTAYQIAQKHDILPLLPILIIEKMGPHFAIGDTCYSHEEDAPHPSFVNGKEMIAVENEKSATRREDPINAYTQKHMDITLPYEMLESITVIRRDGTRQDIIRNGLFVVPGTDELNIPLYDMQR